MKRIGKAVITVARILAAVLVGLLGGGDTPWLRKKVEEEDEQTGKLV